MNITDKILSAIGKGKCAAISSRQLEKQLQLDSLGQINIHESEDSE